MTTHQYHTGDKVIIKTGTYAGQVGTVQRVDDLKPMSFAFVSVGREICLTYRFDELDPSPSTSRLDSAFRRATQP